jgi:signal peptidase I
MSVTSGTKTESGLGETIRVVIHALLIALVIRTFLFQPFNIPSGSMKATLLVGDYLFVSKYSYGYSHYSIPLSPPLFSGRIFGSEPNRGDIVVFRLPKDDTTDYIKRVITSTTSRSSASVSPTSSARIPAAPTPPPGSSAGRKRCRTA